VGKHPTLVTKLPNGIRIDYGSGYNTPQGTLKGAIEITYSGVSTSGNTISGSYTVTPKSFTRDGQSLPFTTIGGTASATLTSGGAAQGYATVNGSNPVTGGTISGRADFDTTVCAKYPISGSVTYTVGGQSNTMTFNRNCDGTFGVSGSGLTNYVFWAPLNKCDGTPQAYDDKVAVLLDGTNFTVNPTCSGTAGTGTTRASGTYSPTSARLVFRSTFPGDRTHVYQGVFTGTSSSGGLGFDGTITFTVTVYSGGSVVCSSPPYTRQGSLWRNNGAPCF